MTTTINQKGYVDAGFLHGISEQFHHIKQRTYAHLQLGIGYKVLDVGCGPGSDTLALAKMVAPSGRIVGVDHDPTMVAEANARAEEVGVEHLATHLTASATDLPFADHYFNASRSERLFQHLRDPSAALAEMVRVTAPGGWLVVADTDWSSLSVDCPTTYLERRLRNYLTDSFLHNGGSGRQLYRLFKQHNLTDIRFEVVPLATAHYDLYRMAVQAERVEIEAVATRTLSVEELRRWRSELETAAAADTFFSCVNTVIVAGRKHHGG